MAAWGAGAWAGGRGSSLTQSGLPPDCGLRSRCGLDPSWAGSRRALPPRTSFRGRGRGAPVPARLGGSAWLGPRAGSWGSGPHARRPGSLQPCSGSGSVSTRGRRAAWPLLFPQGPSRRPAPPLPSSVHQRPAVPRDPSYPDARSAARRRARRPLDLPGSAESPQGCCRWGLLPPNTGSSLARRLPARGDRRPRAPTYSRTPRGAGGSPRSGTP